MTVEVQVVKLSDWVSSKGEQCSLRKNVRSLVMEGCRWSELIMIERVGRALKLLNDEDDNGALTLRAHYSNRQARCEGIIRSKIT